MSENKEQFKKEDCDRNMEIIMLKFENKLMSGISNFTKSIHGSFAKKEDLKALKIIVDKIIVLHEKRQYEWLKYAVITGISIMLTAFITNLTK